MKNPFRYFKGVVTLTGFTANFRQSAFATLCDFNDFADQVGAEIGLYLLNVTIPAQ